MKILALPSDRSVSEKVIKQLKSENEVDVKWPSKNEELTYDVLYLDLIHLDMDIEFEDVVDGIDERRLQFKKIVFLATAGIDQEIDPTWLVEQDKKELLLESQYVAKLVDETEIPYSILRAVEVNSELQNEVGNVIKEGQTIDNKQVSESFLQSIILEAIQSDNYINQSIGISN